jgi:hypothetical protein
LRRWHRPLSAALRPLAPNVGSVVRSRSAMHPACVSPRVFRLPKEASRGTPQQLMRWAFAINAEHCARCGTVTLGDVIERQRQVEC